MIIEQVIIEYLKNELKIPVLAEVPNKKSDKYVIVEKIEGGISNYINSSSLSIYSYANTLYAAADLNEKVKESMLKINSKDEISSCKLGGEDRSIDKSNKEYRYESIFNLYHY